MANRAGLTIGPMDPELRVDQSDFVMDAAAEA